MTQIQTVIRIRPPISQDLKFSQKNNAAIKISNQQVRIQRGDYERREFTFDRVFDENDQQTQVYDYIQEGILSDIQNGINRTILTYGQTSSGKTYTLFGSESSPLLTGKNQFYPEQTDGILPRLLQSIFQQLPSQNFTCTLQYVQLYNNNIYDLLQKNPTPLKLKQNETSLFNHNSLQIQISTLNSIIALLTSSASRRVNAQTQMNANSSRSHTILSLNFTFNSNFHSTLTFCDLAGSERVQKTNSRGLQLEEAKCINQSLSCLQNVVLALSSRKKHVPFRDSTLTKLLQNSLSGNAKTTIFGNIGPCEAHFEESFSSLNFVNRCKAIRTNLRANKGPSQPEKIAFDGSLEMTVFGRFGLVAEDKNAVGYVRCCCGRCGCNLTVVDEGDFGESFEGENEENDDINDNDDVNRSNSVFLEQNKGPNTENLVKSLQMEIDVLRHENMRQKQLLEVFFDSVKVLRASDHIREFMGEIGPEVEVEGEQFDAESPQNAIYCSQDVDLGYKRFEMKKVEVNDADYEFSEKEVDRKVNILKQPVAQKTSLLDQMNQVVQSANEQKAEQAQMGQQGVVDISKRDYSEFKCQKVKIDDDLVNKYLNKGPKLIITKNSLPNEKQKFRVPDTPQGCF
ncbi:Kinesin-like protein [Spironucleus salmonicida]|uniref:Kinesin-like protein n=1 Tax=Spironucleus salmonicida TaxID=348837 RepID=V6LG00_9EUKA|nr:Kinesin-like protein [Spironucleus salmonicida]|eukprot:EST43437.1 Kinesin [Spironucleus salmonicida]